MAKRIFLLSILLIPAFVRAQNSTVRGTVVSQADRQPLPGVNVVARRITDGRLSGASITDAKGKFEISLRKGIEYKIQISFIGYQTFQTDFTLGRDTVLGTIALMSDTNLLEDVIVIGEVIPIQVKGDTTEYAADAFKVNPDASVADLLKKLPGIAIENGQIKSQGQVIDRVLVDKEEFFGNDALSIVQNLPADIADRIQIYEERSEQARFSGFDDGRERRVLNIVTRKEKRFGNFGKLEAGAGTNDRYALGGNINFFRNKERISITGQYNNLNQLNVGQEDPLAGAQFRRFRQFLPAESAADGINTLSTFGINYQNSGSKWKLSTGYNFRNNVNDLESKRVRETFLNETTSQFADESQIAQTTTQNHRLNARFEYNIDSLHSIVFLPNISYNFSERFDTTNTNTKLGKVLPVNQGNNRFSNKNDTWAVQTQLIFRKKFIKPGRTFSVDASYNQSNTTALNLLLAENIFFINNPDTTFRDQKQDRLNEALNTNVRLSYSEPINATNSIEFNYAPEYRITRSNQYTASINAFGQTVYLPDTALSNEFDNFIHTQRAGVKHQYRTSNEKFTLTTGVDLAYTQLFSQQLFPEQKEVDKPFRNIFPSVFFRYRIGPRQNFRINYTTSNNLPTVSQLQNVIDNSNPLVLTTGNSNLEQEFSHNFRIAYGFFNFSGKGGFLSLSYGVTNNPISNISSILLQDSILPDGTTIKRGTQVIVPENLTTRTNANFFGAFNMPLPKLKVNLSMNGAVGWLQNPSRINGLNNRVDNYSTNGGLGISSNLGEKIDFNLRTNLTYFIVNNQLQPELNNNYWLNLNSASFTILPWKGLVVNADFTQTRYIGLADAINPDFIRLNGYLGYKFLKNKAGELRLSVYDLLNQNTSINRTVTELFVEDTQALVLNRFYLISFIYQFRNYRGNRAPKAESPAFQPPR